MLTTIITWLSQSWFGSIVSLALQWFATAEANQSAADSAESTAEQQHNSDGAQSVADQQSDDAQNAALSGLAASLDNPVPVTVTPAPVTTQPKGP